MTIRKESKQYIRQQRKIDADLVKRPNEILKRTTDDGNLKLTFKSPAYYEKDIVITKNAMLSSIPLIKSYKPLETSESFILDLEGQEIITYDLTQNTTITDVINYNNGMSYKLYLKQDEVGGKSFVFDETISNITLFDNFQIDQTPNSITQIKIDVVEDTLYVQSYVKYKKVEYSEFGSIAFTIDTTLGDGQSTFTLPLKEQQNVYIYDPESPDYYDSIEFGDYMNFDFVVDWGDGQSDHITSFNDLTKTHTYSTNGIYSIKMTGLIEGFGIITNGYEWSYTTEDYEKIITVDEISYTGLKECDMMFNECSNLTSFNNVSGDWCKNITNMWYIFGYCSSLTTLDVSNWDVSNVTGMWYIFDGCESLTELDVSNWDVSNVTDMRNMFRGCSSLETLDVSNWDVSNVNTMYGMFYGCSSLTTLDVSNWDVSNVTGMYNMFYDCSSLTTLDISNWDVSNVTSMYSLFNRCTSLTTLDISNWNVSNVTNMSNMFYDCSSLTTLDVSNWDVSNVTDMRNMFRGCSSLETLDVSNWDVSNVTNMSNMFYDCSSLTTLDVSNWDVSNVNTMYGMFYGCSSLTTLDVSNWDVSNVTNMSNMFNGLSLTTLDVSNWNVSNVTNMYYMFTNTPLDTTSYNALLIRWSGLPSLQPSIRFHANSAKYSSGEAATARGILTSAPNYWIIVDAGQVA